MDSSYAPQVTSGLAEYRTVGSILFIVFIMVILIAFFNVLKFHKRRPGARVGPIKAMFAELEKSFRWRRLKVTYLAISIAILLLVIATSYGMDAQAPLQTAYAFEVERATARIQTVIALIVTTLLLWMCYFIVLPFIYKSILNTKSYLHNQDKN